MTRVGRTIFALFVMLFVAGAVNAVLISAAPGDVRGPWIVWTGTGVVVLAAAFIWWKAITRRKS